ncbi:hypothetical protein STRDD12_01556 [Streptococcus sp. DD12]|nr:hypothetical protein STRDD12_01556 [Streptococcus sp. DD12]
MAIVLLGMGFFNLSRNMDFLHQTINLAGLSLIVFSLLFKNWGIENK